MIPCLMITYNRLSYTKQALRSLIESDCGRIFLIDNNSTDGTKKWIIKNFGNSESVAFMLCKNNHGIAGAMNIFLLETREFEFVAKADNDTIVPKIWCEPLKEKLVNCNLDMIQAKHSILKATYPQGFDAWMKTMQQHPKDKSVYLNHFIGGSGIVFRRDKVDKIPGVDSKIMGWREFQRQHPELKKAFTTDVEIKLLDMNECGAKYEKKYEGYYRETKRI